METIFKDDDRVYLNLVGWGTIIDVTDYDISVKFDTGDVRHISGDVRKLLSFTEYTLEGFSQERPDELPNVGEAVWVRDHEFGNWNVSMFLEYDPTEKGGPYIVTSTFIEGDHECYRYMTTKNPYANEQ